MESEQIEFEEELLFRNPNYLAKAARTHTRTQQAHTEQIN